MWSPARICPCTVWVSTGVLEFSAVSARSYHWKKSYSKARSHPPADVGALGLGFIASISKPKRYRLHNLRPQQHRLNPEFET